MSLCCLLDDGEGVSLRRLTPLTTIDLQLSTGTVEGRFSTNSLESEIDAEMTSGSPGKTSYKQQEFNVVDHSALYSGGLQPKRKLPETELESLFLTCL